MRQPAGAIEIMIRELENHSAEFLRVLERAMQSQCNRRRVSIAFPTFERRQNTKTNALAHTHAGVCHGDKPEDWIDYSKFIDFQVSGCSLSKHEVTVFQCGQD